MVVWAVVIPVFWYVTLRNLSEGVFGDALKDSRGIAWLHEWHAPLLLLPFVRSAGADRRALLVLLVHPAVRG